MQSQGFHGETISIAVFDGGFTGADSATPFRHLFQNSQVKMTFDFVGNSENVFQYDEHGTEVLSVIGASIPDSFTGGGFFAGFFFFLDQDGFSAYRIQEYHLLFGARKTGRAGG